jgi:hypothetical protein
MTEAELVSSKGGLIALQDNAFANPKCGKWASVPPTIKGYASKEDAPVMS